MEYTRITFRIPADLHQELSESAEKNSRSMNAEIIARLRVAGSSPAGEVQPLTGEDVRRIIQEELDKRRN